jgi:restriction system protein
LSRKGRIVEYTVEELAEKRRRGESRSDWAKAAALTAEEVEAQIAADPDEAGLVVDWERVSTTIPGPDIYDRSPRRSRKKVHWLDVYPEANLSPRDFEILVKSWLDAAGLQLDEYRSQHDVRLNTADGEYQIDITATFSALGAEYRNFIECKRQKNPIKREQVQALLSKLQSIGAQRAILFSISSFQRGAVEFAQAHGVALVRVVDGRTSWIAKDRALAAGADWQDVPDHIPPVVGWLVGEEPEKYKLLDAKHGQYLKEALLRRAA